MRTVHQLGAALLVLLMLAGCEHKELCMNHSEHDERVRLHLTPAWELEWERPYEYRWEENWPIEFGRPYEMLRPHPAKGIRVTAYPDGGGYQERNLPADGGMLALAEGRQKVLFYNNDTEYIVFDNLHMVAGATATTRTMIRGGYQAMHPGERTMNQPDQLYGHFLENYEAQPSTEEKELPVTLHPLTFTYLIRYEFSHGLQYVALARGALAGMAESVYLIDGHTGCDKGTLLYDCRLADYGAEAVVKTFGVPDFKDGSYTRNEEESHFMLNLDVRLYNGQVKTFEFDVTSELLKQPRGGVITVRGIEISDEDGEQGSGSFDPDVDGWGDWVDIPLPIG